MSSPRARVARRAVVPLVSAGAVVLVTALPAVAHVEVSSPDAAPGGFGTLVFSVPTESATASTTRVRVDLPTKAPFASVSVRPVPGWTVSTRERRLPKPVRDDGFTLTRAVSTVTWSARPGRGIRPGEYDEFELSVGPFPTGVSSVAMPVSQTYSDGEVVHWNQPSPPGKAEPDHPTPTLALVAEERPASTHGAGGPAPSGSGSAATGSADGVARWLGGAGVGLGLLAVAVALTGRRRVP
jgi:uncharacterized protein YcnI